MRGQTLSVRFAIVDKRLRSGAPGSASYNSSGGPYTVSVSLQVPDPGPHAIFWVALRIYAVCPAHKGRADLTIIACSYLQSDTDSDVTVCQGLSLVHKPDSISLPMHQGDAATASRHGQGRRDGGFKREICLLCRVSALWR